MPRGTWILLAKPVTTIPPAQKSPSLLKNMNDLNTPNISVVVCTFNLRSSLAQLLEGLNNQTYPYFELILVDNGPFPFNKNHLEASVSPYHFPKTMCDGVFGKWSRFILSKMQNVFYLSCHYTSISLLTLSQRYKSTLSC